jgi:Protein of unknown function (DUF3306)
MSDREEGFLARWSRRKREAAQAPAAPAPPVETDARAPEPPAPVAEDAAPAFDPASLPPVESLTPESDITAFLRAEVPAALRQAALRRIWSLDPAIRDFIGPADYAWDYNAPDGVPGFALELGGDVKRLLAQAIGLGEEQPDPAEPEPAPEQVEAGVPSGPAPPEPAPPEPAPPEPARLEPAGSEPAGVEPDMPPVAQATGMAEPPAPRRHGRALPS